MVASQNTKILNFFLLTLFFSVGFYFIPMLLGLKVTNPLEQLAPGIIALILWNFYDEKDDVMGVLKKRIVPSMKPKLSLVFLTLSPFLVLPVALLFYDNTISFQGITFSFLVWAIVGAFAEELGWRAYLQYRFGLSNNLMIATFFTSIFWFACQFKFLIHMDVFFNIMLLFLMFSFSVILSILFYKSGRNIFLGFVFHATHNILAGILIGDKFGDFDMFFTMTFVYFILALFLIYKNKRLFQLEQINH